MTKIPNQKEQIPIVIDPFISSKLRPHQREGVSFLYECVMGIRGIHDVSEPLFFAILTRNGTHRF